MVDSAIKDYSQCSLKYNAEIEIMFRRRCYRKCCTSLEDSQIGEDEEHVVGSMTITRLSYPSGAFCGTK